MNELTRKKLDAIDAMAAADMRYREMLNSCKQAEKLFDSTVKHLPDKQRDLIWDYVMLCETMSRYVLELACMHMEFVAPESDVGEGH